MLYSLKSLLDPDVPNNQGMIDPVDHCARWARCERHVPGGRRGARQHVPAHRRRDVRRARPGDPGGRGRRRATARTPRRSSSGTIRATAAIIVYLETLGGGFGGRFTKDGNDGVQVHITNTSNLPVESIEKEYPLLVESYGFVPGLRRRRQISRRARACGASVRPLGHTMTFSAARASVS